MCSETGGVGLSKLSENNTTDSGHRVVEFGVQIVWFGFAPFLYDGNA